MVTNRKWQFACILIVALLTIYNILPTLCYYTKPLHEQVDQKTSEDIRRSISQRVDSLEKNSIEWLQSYCELLSVQPKTIALNPKNPEEIDLVFTKSEDAKKFSSKLPRAGSLISFSPARLKLGTSSEDGKTVTVRRNLSVRLTDHKELFSFAAKRTEAQNQIVCDRAAKLIDTLIQADGNKPSFSSILAILKQEGRYQLGSFNPIFSEVSLDFANEKIHLGLHANKRQDKAYNDQLVKQVSLIHRTCNEEAKPSENGFEIAFHFLPENSANLIFHLDALADIEVQNLVSTLQEKWHPKHPDLKTMSIVDSKSYEALSIEQKALSLIAFSPFHYDATSLPRSSLFLVAKGLDRIAKNYEEFPDSPLKYAFQSDLQELYRILASYEFTQFPQSITIPFSGDFLLEKQNFAAPIIAATRENFQIRGSQKYAVLELSNFEQRILTENKIETSIHQELIQWQEDYLAAQVHLNSEMRFDTPKPPHSVFWSNFSLSLRKMLRGDENKIIRWGLDLSGGKTVEIELRDSLNNKVQTDADLKQGIRELYSRVNKMGLSEVSIRQVGSHIVLDFPGSQSLSASELIKASTMHFHVVNEKFSPNNSQIGKTVHQFLQNVWDEAVFMGKTDAQSINAIALKHLYGPDFNEESAPISEIAKILVENGLNLKASHEMAKSGIVDDTTSKIAVFRGSSPAEWHGMSHPLFFVFRQPALEGAHLQHIQSSYDPSRGNYLSFSIASSFQTREGIRCNPQSHLFAWTSKYSKDGVLGTSNETYSSGRGWKMAVILNDTAINAPTLESALKDSGMISGSFSQSEVQRLTADLTAGSLSFTPHILSEKNVSPELGKTDRTKGILATIAAFILVLVCMVSYYRFAGFVASIAVLFNLLMLWAILQNLGATLTLAGIAGIILTVGMSIDANVLVFERIKEEFAITQKISSAIRIGYKKAFSAIVDSNITTIIAALILLNFDAGPIKSFAMNLIIGIASSMFTALFMTRFYFTGWAQNPKNTMLKMAHWIRFTRFDFLSKTKIAMASSIATILIGGYCLAFKSSSILGLDFTGGYSIHLEVDPSFKENLTSKIEKALLAQGASSKDFQIREMNPSHHLRILFAGNMEQKGKPFHGLALESGKSDTEYAFENNPRICWIVDALKQDNITLLPDSLKSLHANWTAVSGQMSDTMRNSAIFGFLLSFVGIFVYLAFRFEYKFAAAAILCLIHDVLITLSIMGLLHFAGVPVQIDLITIAALMTAVGYSLNDTIIIFDRIREEIQLHQKRSLWDTVNHALNFTLSRTMITSGSTFLVLLALLVLGGASIFGFALVMTIGVVFGTLSSWFIAAPLMLYFHKKEEMELKTVK